MGRRSKYGEKGAARAKASFVFTVSISPLQADNLLSLAGLPDPWRRGVQEDLAQHCDTHSRGCELPSAELLS